MQEQRLPIVRRLDDIASLAHVLDSRASIRLQRGDHERGGLQEIYEDLAEASESGCKLGRPDAISGVGWLLAQVLTRGGLRDEALSVLDEVEVAWRKLGNAQGLAQVAELRASIGAAD